VRGYGVVVRTIKRFLEMHGYNIHLGAWVDVKIRGRLVLDLQVGHWAFHRHPKRGVPAALYVFAEGPIDPKAKSWLKEYDYLIAPSRFVAQELQKLDLDNVLMPVGIDTEFFKPLNTHKFIDVLSVGIWDSDWDDRKFMDKVCEVAFPNTCYAHTKPTLPRDWMPWLYSSAKVYLSLAGCEGFNIPVVEANACGVPVVYNEACATAENAYGVPVKPKGVKVVVKRGIPFYIYEPDLERIKAEVNRLLKDDVLRNDLGREARVHARAYDFRRTFKRLLEILPPPP